MASVIIHYLNGETRTYQLTAGDLSRFAKRYGQRALEQDPAKLPIDQQLFVAWSAARRTGDTTLELADWLDVVTGADEGPDD